MHTRLLIFAIVFIIAVALALETVPMIRETFQRADAALVCYWADPGPPLPVPIPKDPESILPRKEGPKTSAVDFPISKTLQKQNVNYAMQPRPNRSSLRQAKGPQVPPLPSQSPYQITTTPSTPVPVLGTLALPPENPVTQRPSL